MTDDDRCGCYDCPSHPDRPCPNLADVTVAAADITAKHKETGKIHRGTLSMRTCNTCTEFWSLAVLGRKLNAH